MRPQDYRAARVKGVDSPRLWLVVATALCVAAVTGPAAGQEAGSLRIGWRAAAGPVVSYDVYVEQNGASMVFYGAVSGTEAELSGPQFARGDALRFEVRARSADGRQGRASEVSDVVFFESIGAPQGLAGEAGSPRDPNLLSWDPVEYADFYVVFRSRTAGQNGVLLDQSDVPSFEDIGAEPGVTYYYAVAAVYGQSVGELSAQLVLTRGDAFPSLSASAASVAVTIGQRDLTASATVQLSNDGGWELTYAAGAVAPWPDASPTNGIVDEAPQPFTLTFSSEGLAPGDHDAVVYLYAYYKPPSGEQFVLGPPLTIDVHLTVEGGNAPPFIGLESVVAVKEGAVLVLPIQATDPNPGDLVEVGVGTLPSFASFRNIGSGQAELTLAPGYESSGTYTGVITVSDDGDPALAVFEEFVIFVLRVNRPPIIDEIPDQTAIVGESTTVPISSFDPDVGDRIAIATGPLPAFMTLTVNGDGTAEISLAPGPEDVGSYAVVVGAHDSGRPSQSSLAWFIVTIVSAIYRVDVIIFPVTRNSC